MIRALLSLLSFLRRPTIKNWRAHRRNCVALLPKVDKGAA